MFCPNPPVCVFDCRVFARNKRSVADPEGIRHFFGIQHVLNGSFVAGLQSRNSPRALWSGLGLSRECLIGTVQNNRSNEPPPGLLNFGLFAGSTGLGLL